MPMTRSNLNAFSAKTRGFASLPVPALAVTLPLAGTILLLAHVAHTTRMGVLVLCGLAVAIVGGFTKIGSP